METKLKTYRSERRFEADWPLMEAQGWRVRSGQRRSADSRVELQDLGRVLPDIDDRLNPWQQTDWYPGAIGAGVARYPFGIPSAAGSARVLALPFLLVAWPFAWALAKWRSGTYWDVLYERPDGPGSPSTARTTEPGGQALSDR